MLRLFVHRCSTGGYPDQGAQRYGPAGLGLKGETNAMPAHNIYPDERSDDGAEHVYPEERSEDFYPAECNEDAVAD